jgi:hypothetical protein
MASSNTVKATYTEGAVTTSAATVLASKGNRKYLLLQNTGTVDVYVTFGSTATADADSFVLLADGVGTIMMDMTVESAYVSAITASGSSTLKIGEA